MSVNQQLTEKEFLRIAYIGALCYYVVHNAMKRDKDGKHEAQKYNECFKEKRTQTRSFGRKGF